MALSHPVNTNFGETPSAAVKVRGAERLLTITELHRVGSSLQPTGIEFKFSRENFSAPRGPQSFGVELRTSRQDLPGSEEPIEQVLGWNYTNFNVTGVWDDRYAGKGFAEQTRRDFESMVKRGNPVRYQFEQVSITGLIKNLTINWKRADYQGYTFTFSPHFRYEGETVRVDSNIGKKIVHDPRTSVLKARAALEALKAAQDLARQASLARVQSLLKSGLFTTIGNAIDSVETAITSAENTVNKEVLNPAQNAANALNRAAQAMASVKTACSTILSTTRSIAASSEMSISSIAETLKFENWQRLVSANARAMIVIADQTAQDFKLRAQPKPVRMHRVRQGESLYQISNRYYGTPHQWRSILELNKLSSIVLTGGELLSIPEIKL